MSSLLQSSSPIRRRIGYSIASLFILWHVTVIAFMGPWPFDSRVQDFLEPVLAPYMYSLQLGAGWVFYAPDVRLGSVLRYDVISTETGQRHRGKLTETLSKSDSAYYRYTTIYTYLADYPKFRTSFLQYLCRKHVDLAPSIISLDVFRQRRLGPDDYLAGNRPLDAKFLRRSNLAKISCSAQQPG